MQSQAPMRNISYRNGEDIADRLSLGSLPGRIPVTASADSTIRDAIQLMDQNRVGSVVIVDPQTRKPVGILTLQDVLRRVTLPAIEMSGSVQNVMTRQVETMQEAASVYEGLLFMSQHRIRHLPILRDNGELSGVVSLNQLRDPFVGTVDVAMRRIDDATNIAELAERAQEARMLGVELLAKYGDSGMLTSVLTALNDGVFRRIIEMVVADFGRPPVPWCWIVMGSEGRFEQTFHTDQDNGLIFTAENTREADALRLHFLPQAQQVNRYLDQCGIPHCAGGIMAGNPECCLSIDEWKQRFHKWVRSPDPEALLRATIYFDFRPIYGDNSLARELSDHLLQVTGGQGIFFRLLAENALMAPAPIGVVRDFITEKGADNARHIDLKKFGARLFVDAARIFALATGSHETSTIARLRAAGRAGGIHVSDIDSAVQAFTQVQRIRMTNQARAKPDSDGNLLEPNTLNRLDRKILQESLRQAQSLQSKLRQVYAIY